MRNILNPYIDVNFTSTPKVPANSHEHIYTGSTFEQVYRKGTRIFACVNYFPSAPSVCPAGKLGLVENANFSNWRIPVEDWIDPKNIPAEVQSNAFNMSLSELSQYKTTRYYEGNYPTITDSQGNVIQTNSIPQISNMEFAFLPWVRGNISDRISQHFNVLGNLFAIPTNGMDYHAIYEGMTWDEEKAWRGQHPLYSMEELMSYVTNSAYQQFEGKIFGTANHNYDVTGLKKYFDRYPQVFKAMECFNQCYSRKRNNAFRNAYDSLLKQGYRIWGTAVSDWNGTREQDLMPNEQTKWIARYNALTPEEQAQYGNWKNYYNAVAEKECPDRDRGCNVLYIPNYDTMLARNPQEVAEAALDAYIAGRYYMSGWGNYSINNLDVTDTTVTITLSDPAQTLVGISNKDVISSSGSTITVPVKDDTIYVRFEAYYPDADFIFTNPVFFDVKKKKDNKLGDKCITLGII